MFYAYTRVSTPRQGENGVSLQEQRDVISRYAVEHGLQIIAWFEERDTAAKSGRPVFNRMLRSLQQHEVNGVVIHKIDRGARNLKDWADLGELLDIGIDVRFANDGLDLHTRSGRLSADIQAVVAADYIRNLREETRKGFYGRLKQGFFPLPAPIGYCDNGGGQPKTIDPVTGPIVRRAFQMYAEGTFPQTELLRNVTGLGLRNRRGQSLSKTVLSHLLRNPFYTGQIQLRASAEKIHGKHEPLISMTLFNEVQAILKARRIRRPNRHQFLFRRMLLCGDCGYCLIGELQKGHVYYRCHTNPCRKHCFREEIIEEVVDRQLGSVAGNEFVILAYRRASIAQKRRLLSHLLSGEISVRGNEFEVPFGAQRTGDPTWREELSEILKELLAKSLDTPELTELAA